MTGEIQFMRKQIFGGFNRKDAVAYVAKIAKERNDARDANEEALRKIESLKSEIYELREKLEVALSNKSESNDNVIKPVVKANQTVKQKVVVPKVVKAKLKPRV